MGRFDYEGVARAQFEDRLLAHLQVVIRDKLRRREPFMFTWPEDISTGGGRTAVWMHPAAMHTFTFSSPRLPRLNPVWLEALLMEASSTGGLTIVDEPDPPAEIKPKGL